jgi:hypothetical protein
VFAHIISFFVWFLMKNFLHDRSGDFSFSENILFHSAIMRKNLPLLIEAPLENSKRSSPRNLTKRALTASQTIPLARR